MHLVGHREAGGASDEGPGGLYLRFVRLGSVQRRQMLADRDPKFRYGLLVSGRCDARMKFFWS